VGIRAAGFPVETPRVRSAVPGERADPRVNIAQFGETSRKPLEVEIGGFRIRNLRETDE